MSDGFKSLQIYLNKKDAKLSLINKSILISHMLFISSSDSLCTISPFYTQKNNQSQCLGTCTLKSGLC